MRKKIGKRFISLLLAIVVLLMAGCGKTDGTEKGGGSNDSRDNDGQQATMGRYVETETDLSERLERPTGIYRMPDGKLVIIDLQGEFLVSEDNGNVWENSSRQWIQDKAADCYLMDVKIDEKGVIGIIYAEKGGEESDVESGNQSSLQCALLFPDESVVSVEFSEDEAGESIDRFWISDTGRYFVSTMEGDIYEVKEDGVIYLAGKKGLHRHVMGGAAMEQIIDGKLSCLGNPQYGVVGMLLLNTGEFLALSDRGKLINFTYDPNKEAVPQERLKIYSLEKNNDMYTAVSYYQIQNPDVFVEYEIGMEEGSAVTKEDAIKKLNTQIMAGEGPDILMLDGLPIDSYVEKGMLCELNNVVDTIENDVFRNLIYAFAKEDRIYAVPGQIGFPVMMGKKEDVSQMTNLMAMADGIERMRGEMPEKDLIGLSSEKAVMKLCSIISAQEWKKNYGEIDRKAIEKFLTQAKRIYDAQMNGLGEESVVRLRRSDEYHVQYRGENWMYDLNNYTFYMDYAAGYYHTYAGVSFSPNSYIELASVSKTTGFEDTALMPMTGEKGCVFIPETILGINAAAQRKELAEDFIKMFLGKENQSSLSGYAVNKEAFAETLKARGKDLDENEEYKVCVVYEDGTELALDIIPPDDGDIAAVMGWMESAEIPYIENVVFEECVFEEGSGFILGERGIEETLDAVEGRLAIYIAGFSR